MIAFCHDHIIVCDVKHKKRHLQNTHLYCVPDPRFLPQRRHMPPNEYSYSDIYFFYYLDIFFTIFFTSFCNQFYKIFVIKRQGCISKSILNVCYASVTITKVSIVIPGVVL